MIVVVALALVVIVLAIVMLVEPRRSDYEQRWREPDEGGLEEADVAEAERPQGNVYVLPPAEPDEDLREPGA